MAATLLNVRMIRWVERVSATTVRFGNIVGPYVGGEYIYDFPDETLADEFEALVRGLDENGFISAVDPTKWAAYRRGRISP